jgi:streptogramin lyase
MGISRDRIGGGCLACRLLVLWVVALGALGLDSQAAAANPVGQITEFPGLPAGSSPDGITWGEDGNLWFTDPAKRAIGRLDPSTGQITEFSNGLPAGGDPLHIADYCGYLYFTDSGTGKIGRLDPSTGQITEFSSGLNPGSKPFDIATRGLGGVFFTDQGTTPAIGVIGCDGSITEYSSGLNSSSVPVGIAPDNGNTVWFTDDGATKAIGKFNIATDQISETGAGLDPSSDPEFIAPGPDGNFWFTDPGVPAIGRLNPSTGQIDEFGSSHGLNPGSYPVGIVPGQDGNVWFTDDGSLPGIGRITDQGQVTEFSSSGIIAPSAIAFGHDGNLWFTDPAGPAIGRVGTGALPPIIAGPLVQGGGRVGSKQTCALIPAAWGGISPGVRYQWRTDAGAIEHATDQTYVPIPSQVGHKLFCAVSVEFPFPFLFNVPATSAPITVQPFLFRRPIILPHTFYLQGRRVGADCAKATPKNNGNPRCQRPIRLRFTYTLSVATTVTFTLKRQGRGEKVKGHCVKPTNKNKGKPGCERFIKLKGKITRAGKAGTNSFTFKGKIRGHSIIPAALGIPGNPITPVGPINFQLIVTPAGGAPQTVSFKIAP